MLVLVLRFALGLGLGEGLQFVLEPELGSGLGLV